MANVTNSQSDAGKHNNATLTPARMSDNVMFFTGQARLISPGSSPALRCSACTDPRLPRRAQPPHGTERASIFPPARIRFSSAVFFPPFVFLTSGNEREELERSTRSRPPHARTASITHTRLTRQRNSSSSREITSAHS
ncbi:hypothetical protein ABG768_020711 [Culter alburnus]|uniref:Uncharacterized protein n=1 Tax=Culter alburnus TaxID=194366 RepID=A0AAW2B3G4_CULAL